MHILKIRKTLQIICISFICIPSLFALENEISFTDMRQKQFKELLNKRTDNLLKREMTEKGKLTDIRRQKIIFKKPEVKIPQVLHAISKRSKLPAAHTATTLIKEVDVTIAGTLFSYFTTNELQVTDLTVTGKMDARDFKFIRESLNYLNALDIRNVSIVAYIGTEGTDTIGVSKTYPENVLPQCSFWNSETHIVTNLNSIILPNTITAIGDFAFLGQDYLSTIEIPHSVNTIGRYAFQLCENLSSIQIPSSVIEIKNYAFSRTGLESIFIPSTVNIMGELVFWENSKLKSVVIASKETGYGTFKDCPLLNSVSFAPTLKRINKSAFDGTGVSTIDIPYTVDYVGRSFDDCFNLTSAIIAADTIGLFAFYNSNLASLTVTNDVSYIDDWAFTQTQLTSITIPASVDYVGESFNDCPNLTTAIIAADTIGNSAFEDSNLASVTITNDVSYIDHWAFEGTQLTSVTIPASVTEMGGWVFYDCQKLTSADISSKIIGEYCFAESNLNSVNLSEGVEFIYEGAFELCENLSSITIPASVDSIGQFAFGGGIGAISVNTGNTKYASQDGVLFNKDFTCLIQYPYRKGSYTIPSSVTTIGSFAFGGGVSSVNVPSSVTTIEPFGFSNYGIENDHIFSGDTLKSVVFDNNSKLEEIGDFVFAECIGLKSCVIPSLVRSIGIGAFMLCSELSAINIPSLVNTIHEAAFAGCIRLNSIYSFATTPPALITLQTEDNLLHVFELVDTDNCVLSVPTISKSLYQNSADWNIFKNIVEFDVPEQKVSEPQASIASGTTVSKGSTVELSCPTSGAIIYYTVDETSPEATGSSRMKYQTPVVINKSMILNAIATKDGFENSEVVSYFYRVDTVADVTASILSGSIVQEGITVSLSCATNGSDIYYTLDGTSPADLSGTRSIYNQPITIDRNMTILAIAEKEGLFNSNVSEFTYYLDPESTIDVIISRKWDDVLVCHNTDDLFTTYQWYKNEIILTGETKQYYQETGGLNGSYHVEVTTTDGYTGTSNIIMVGTPAIGIKVYPNPVERGVNINVSIKSSVYNDDKVQLYLYNTTGDLILHQSGLQSEMSLKELSQGSYVLRIVLPDSQILSEKIIVN